MARQAALGAGTVVWIPCELKSGLFPTERHVKIEVSVGDHGEISGFIPNEDVRSRGANPEHGYVRAVVLRAINGKVELLLRGEIFSTGNRVVVPREWLEEAGDFES
jgi:hypothetical protein